MKKTLLFLFLAIASNSLAQNQAKNSAPEFIVQMANVRLMDREGGRLAASLGSTKEIRDYGTLMMKDQDVLWNELNQLAVSKNITLPMAIGEKKSEALRKLATLTGRQFDRKFTKLIQKNHKRDVKRFEKAVAFEDSDTKQFAKKHLPTIQSHLDGVEQLRK